MSALIGVQMSAVKAAVAEIGVYEVMERCAAIGSHSVQVSHNHHVELRKYEGLTLLEHFRSRTEVLAFQLDIHWLHRGGVDPVEYLHRFAGRTPYLHLKDYRIAPFQLPADRATFLTAFHGLIEFAEIGDGNLPIAACIDAGVAGGCEDFYVEQDDTYGRDPFESLSISRANPIALGYNWL